MGTVIRLCLAPEPDLARLLIEIRHVREPLDDRLTGRTDGSCDDSQVRRQGHGQKLHRQRRPCLNRFQFLHLRDAAWALRSPERGPPVDHLRAAAAHVRGSPPGGARPLRGVSGAGERTARRRGPPQLRRAGVSRVPAVPRSRRRFRTVAVYGVRVRSPRSLLLPREGVLPELRWAAHGRARCPSRRQGVPVGARAPVGPELAAAPPLSAGLGSRSLPRRCGAHHAGDPQRGASPVECSGAF